MRLFCIILVSSFLLGGVKVTPIRDYKLQTIIIDIGHGGKDPGCQFYGYREDLIAFAVAEKIKEKLNRTFPKIKVIFTRKKSETLSQRKRAQFINNTKGDLLISIHCNSCAKNRQVSGYETHIMGKKAYWPSFKVTANLREASLKMLQKENKILIRKKDFKRNSINFDKNAIYSKIHSINCENVYFNNSLVLANILHNKMKQLGRKTRGTLESDFLLLWKIAFPCLLLEIGYLSNKAEAKYLSSKKGQDQIAQAICAGIKDYKSFLEGSGKNS